MPGSSRDLGGRFHVHRMKGLSSVLNVETNRVDNTLGTGNGRLHRPLVMCISGDPFDTSILAQSTMARDYAHADARLGQMAHHTTAQKSGPAEHGCAVHFRIREMIVPDVVD